MDNNTQRFLNIISQIESSGGKNVNHVPMTKGLHAGTSAYGKFGLTPNTTLDTIARLKSLNKLNETTSPMVGMTPEQVNPYLQQNPEAETQVADFLARNLLARNKGNEEAAAIMWNRGHNLQPNDITEDQMISDPYVSKYREFARQKALKKLADNAK